MFRAVHILRKVAILISLYDTKNEKDNKKNAFQEDAYRSLSASHSIRRGWRACLGACMPGGTWMPGGACMLGRGVHAGGMCATHAPPPWTDRHLWKHNLGKLLLRVVIKGNFASTLYWLSFLIFPNDMLSMTTIETCTNCEILKINKILILFVFYWIDQTLYMNVNVRTIEISQRARFTKGSLLFNDPQWIVHFWIRIDTSAKVTIKVKVTID